MLDVCEMLDKFLELILILSLIFRLPILEVLNHEISNPVLESVILLT